MSALPGTIGTAWVEREKGELVLTLLMHLWRVYACFCFILFQDSMYHESTDIRNPNTFIIFVIITAAYNY